METNKNKKSSDDIQITNRIKLKKNQKLETIVLNSSISNVNINYYKNKNIIPLSRLFKYKLNNINHNNNIEESKYNSVGKLPIFPNLRKSANSLQNYNSISHNKILEINLPKIKNNNKNNDYNEIKDSIIISILNKFDEYDNKFREQEKISKLNIQRGDKFLKLKKDYIDENDKYKYCASKHNYKKQYSKLFKRIKNIHLI